MATNIVNIQNYRTSQRKRMEDKWNKISIDFIESWKQNQNIKPNRHLAIIAERYGLSLMGVKRILVSKGIYHTDGKTPTININL